MIRVVFFFGLAVLVLTAGCKKDDDAPRGPPLMTEAERERGEEICRTYITRLCACATSKDSKDLEDRCELHKGRPDTIATALEVSAGGPDVSPVDMAQAQDAARKVMAACVRDLAGLDQEGCP